MMEDTNARIAGGELLRLTITTGEALALDSPSAGVRMIPFTGRCEGAYFTGDVLPGGVDTQRFSGPGEGRLSARYMLEGVDADGARCRMFIENEAVLRDGCETVTRPRIWTDSPALRWMESAALSGRILSREGRLEIVISAEDARCVTIRRAGLTLRALLDRPGDQPCPVVLMLHGFGGRTSDAPDDLFQRLSERLVGRGLATLRIDFNGHGGSEGQFSDMTVYNELEDAAALLGYARGLDFATELYVVGHSQGGVVGGLLAGYYPDVVRRLALLAPAASLKDDALAGRCMGVEYDARRVPDTVEVSPGRAVGGLYFRMAQTLPIYKTTGRFEGPALIVRGGQDGVVSAERIAEYLRALPQGRLLTYGRLDHGLGNDPAEASALLEAVEGFFG